MRFAFAGYGRAADPKLIGGHQSYLRRVAHYLVSHDHSVDFLIQADERGRRTQDETTSHYFPSFAELAKWLLVEPYDWVFFSRFPVRHLGALIQHSRHRVDTRYAYFYLVMPPNPLQRLTRIMLFKLSCEVVVTASFRLQRHVLRWGINSFPLLPPVPNICFEGGVRHSPGECRVAYVGRIGEDKGLRDLANDLRKLSEEYADLRPEIRGYYDPLSKTSRALHQFLSHGPVRYIGLPYAQKAIQSSLDEEEVIQILKAIDILVLPYRRLEGLTIDVPVVLLEAMASGCLVVATSLGDIPTILADQDLIIQESILDTLSRLIESGRINDKRKQLRERARQYGIDIESTGDKFLKHLNSFGTGLRT